MGSSWLYQVEKREPRGTKRVFTTFQIYIRLILIANRHYIVDEIRIYMCGIHLY